MQDLGGKAVQIDMTPFDEAAPMLYQDAFLAERWSAVRGFLQGNKVCHLKKALYTHSLLLLLPAASAT